MPSSSPTVVAERLRLLATVEPDTTALAVDKVGELTYGQWEARSNAMARGLGDHGVSRGDRVVLLFDHAHWCEYAVAYAAVAKVAAVAVPVAPHLTVLQVARVAAHSEASGIVSAGGLAVPDVPCWVATPAVLEGGQDCHSFKVPASPAEPAEVLYRAPPLSSPIATPTQSDQLSADLLSFERPVTLLHAFPFGTACAQAALRLPLHQPRSVSVVQPHFDPARFLELVDDQEVKVLGLPAFVAEAILASVHPDDRPLLSVTDIVTSAPPTEALGARLVTTFPNARLRPEPAVKARRRQPPPPSTTTPQDVIDTIVSIWQGVLGVDREIGPDDDFFVLGGTSLGATRVVSLLCDAFDVEFDLATFLQWPTVRALGAAVEGCRHTDSPPAPPWALSQEAYVWHEQLSPGCMNLPPVARRLTGPLDVGKLELALAELARRHQPLRTSFQLDGGRPVQRVAPPMPVPLPVEDLTALSGADQEGHIVEAVRQAMVRPFDLVEGDVFRPQLLRLGQTDHVLFIPVNHVMWDDWSEVVLKRELSALYTAFVAGRDSPLDPPPLGFADVARRQHRLLAGKTGTSQLRYWKRTLAGAPLVAQLPVHDPGLPAGTPQPAAGPVSVLLPADLTAQLEVMARRQRVSLFMALMAAFSVLVQRQCGQDDVLMSSVVANRDRPELEGLVGGFAKKILLRVRLDDDPQFLTVMKRTRDVLLGALSNQDLPYETVVQKTLGREAAEHGVAPHVGLLFQSLAPPRARLELAGLDAPRVGLDSAKGARVHFAAGRQESSEQSGEPWGAGGYLGTFVRVTVIETKKGILCEAWGAFHRPAVERLLEHYRQLVEDVVARPDRRVSELGLTSGARPGRQVSPGRVTEVELRGLWMDRGRLEKALAACPGVKEAAVTVTSGPSPGSGDERLVAYVVPEGERSPTLGDLRSWLWSTLPGHPWPAETMVVPSIPSEPDGPPMAAVPAAVGAPTPEERLLCCAWAEVLGIEEVDRTENYWQSFPFLDAVDMALSVGFGVTPRHVANNRTVETLAAAVAADRIRQSHRPDPLGLPPTAHPG